MRAFIVALFDVTDLEEEERDGLCLEISVQAERSEYHPSSPGPTIWVIDADTGKDALAIARETEGFPNIGQPIPKSGDERGES